MQIADRKLCWDSNMCLENFSLNPEDKLCLSVKCLKCTGPVEFTGSLMISLLFSLSTDITERSILNLYPMGSAEALELPDPTLKYVHLS